MQVKSMEAYISQEDQPRVDMKTRATEIQNNVEWVSAAQHDT